MKLSVRAVIVAAALTLFLIATASQHLQARSSGQEIVLEAAPVDPRDILLGHYVALRYPVTRLDLTMLAGDDSFAAGDALFLELREDDNGVAQPVALYKERPAAALVLHGVAQTAARRTTDEGLPGAGRFLNADFFLPRRYYADPETARALETQLVEEGFQVILSTAPNRKPVIRGLTVDGVRREDRLF